MSNSKIFINLYLENGLSDRFCVLDKFALIFCIRLLRKKVVTLKKIFFLNFTSILVQILFKNFIHQSYEFASRWLLRYSLRKKIKQVRCFVTSSKKLNFWVKMAQHNLFSTNSNGNIISFISFFVSENRTHFSERS